MRLLTILISYLGRCLLKIISGLKAIIKSQLIEIKLFSNLQYEFISRKIIFLYNWFIKPTLKPLSKEDIKVYIKVNDSLIMYPNIHLIRGKYYYNVDGRMVSLDSIDMEIIKKDVMTFDKSGYIDYDELDIPLDEDYWVTYSF